MSLAPLIEKLEMVMPCAGVSRGETRARGVHVRHSADCYCTILFTYTIWKTKRQTTVSTNALLSLPSLPLTQPHTPTHASATRACRASRRTRRSAAGRASTGGRARTRPRTIGSHPTLIIPVLRRLERASAAHLHAPFGRAAPGAAHGGHDQAGAVVGVRRVPRARPWIGVSVRVRVGVRARVRPRMRLRVRVGSRLRVGASDRRRAG